MSRQPLLRRPRVATIGAPDLGAVEEAYGEWLGYGVVERGAVALELAHAWGSPDMTHRPFVLLRPANGEPTYLRAVSIDPVPHYRALTTFGWSAFELVCEDVYALHARLASSPFRVIGAPRSLGGDLERIHAMQVVGPAEEVLYLTCDTGAAADSILPRAGAFVGHLFIPVLAGPDVAALQDFYLRHFCVPRHEVRNTRTDVINRALGLPGAAKTPMTYAPLGCAGHYLQMDGYPPPARVRPRMPGQLPPGNAGVTFAVDRLSALPRQRRTATNGTSRAYGGRPITIVVGPAGELVELVGEAD